jgi:hypothetical protein
MTLKPLVVLAGLGLLPLLALPRPAAAQPSALNPPGVGAGPSYSLPPAPGRNRIEIHPGRLLYRRCADWYELQYRPSGTVLYPQMRCWWVRG